MRMNSLSKYVMPLIVGCLSAGTAHPQTTNGTWTNAAGGNWHTSTNWASGSIADGPGAIADFSPINITADATVTIDDSQASRTVGTLLFGDTVYGRLLR